jgi:hypothetical protein
MAQNTNCGPYFIFFPEFLPDTNKGATSSNSKIFCQALLNNHLQAKA